MTKHSPIKLNGMVLPPQTIAAEAQHHPAPTPAAAFRAAARALIVRILLLEEARRLGISAEPEFEAPGKQELDEEALIRALIEDKVPMQLPDEKACRDLYDSQPERFRARDLFEVSHILFAAPPRDTEAREKALARASAAIAELAAAPDRFEAIARAQSDCESRANGGRLGQLSEGHIVPEFQEAFAALNEGEISAVPVKTKYGAHVVRLDARATGKILPYEYTREQIAAYLGEQQWRQRVAQYIGDLVANANVEGLEFGLQAGEIAA